MRGRLGSLSLLLAALGLMLFLTGCPKRPALTVAQAPAPVAVVPVPVVPAPTPAPVAPEPAPAPAPAPAPMVTAPTPPPAPPKEYVINDALKAVHFDFDKSNIRPGDARILDSNAEWLRSNPGHLVLIEGHCDERGTNEYNLALGERRAKSVMAYLVAKGIAQARFTTVSYGEERPMCSEKTESCWARNRRAQFLTKEQ